MMIESTSSSKSYVEVEMEPPTKNFKKPSPPPPPLPAGDVEKSLSLTILPPPPPPAATPKAAPTTPAGVPPSPNTPRYSKFLDILGKSPPSSPPPPPLRGGSSARGVETTDDGDDAEAESEAVDPPQPQATADEGGDRETAPWKPPPAALNIPASDAAASSCVASPPPSSSPKPATFNGNGDKKMPSQRRHSRNPASNDSLRGSAHWDGEIALSVLQARPRDERTGRRKSTMGTLESGATAAAASAVGALAAKLDQEEEDRATKKLIREEQRRRHSMQPQSSFEQRLMRKLEESRGDSTSDSSACAMRRSSRYSRASSAGSNFESIEEGSQMNFKSNEEAEAKPMPNAVWKIGEESAVKLSGTQEETDVDGRAPSEDRLPSGETSARRHSETADAVGGHVSAGEPSPSGSPPERNGSETRPARKSPSDSLLARRNSSRNFSNDGPSARRRLERSNSLGGAAARHRRLSSHGSLSAEEYEDFVQRKISSRGEVGPTYSERKRREEEEEEEAALSGGASPLPAASSEGGSATSMETRANSGNDAAAFVARPDSRTLTSPAGESAMSAEVHVSSGNAGESAMSAEVHASPGNSGRFRRLAPRVKDEEEEKVELSSEDDVLAEEEGERSGLELTATCTAVAAAAAAVNASSDADCDEKEHRPASSPGIARYDNNSPFSSMVAERQKVVTHEATSDPEDLVDVDDRPPDSLDLSNSQNPRRSAGARPRGSWDINASLTGSLLAPLDRLRRGAARSLNDGTAAQNANAELRRRDTYAFGTNDVERSNALRELADMVEAQDIVQATLVPDEKPIETVEAIPMDMDDDNSVRREENRRRLRKQVMLIWAPSILLVIVIALAIVVIVGRKGDGDSDRDKGGGDGQPSAEKRVHDPTLVQVRKEGVLRCGVPNKYGFAVVDDITGERKGISVDFCRAVAAAVIGPGYEIELIEVTSITRFTSLAGRDIDLLIWGDTHTMERDFHEGRALVGFQFTDPYFYDGLGFAGKPLAVQCADDFDWRGDCRDLKICVNSGTTHVDILRHIFPDPNIVLRDTKDAFLQEFVDEGCNVIAGEQNDISEVSVRKQGYTGDFLNGLKVLSKEPLAMVTRKGDQSWTDVVNWVLRALIHAEMTNISQENANDFDHGQDGFDTKIDFIGALEAVGNYGDIYSRNMEEVVPRVGLNLIYTHREGSQSGLHYSHPTGSIDEFRHEFAPNGKINRILNRGKLICGVIGDGNQTMETDYCHALSASLFISDSNLVEFVKLSSDDDLMKKLDGGHVDVIAGATVDFHTDVMPSNATASGFSGMALTQPYFYGGDVPSFFSQESSAPKAMATSQNDADWSTFVYWVVANLIWAEESGITSADFRDVPEVKMFGDKFEWMFRGSILAVGNYGEIYERNLKHLPPRANQNLLNDGSSPQLWHPRF